MAQGLTFVVVKSQSVKGSQNIIAKENSLNDTKGSTVILFRKRIPKICLLGKNGLVKGKSDDVFPAGSECVKWHTAWTGNHI